MQAYEFYATPKDGVIHIPDEYKDKIIMNVKVIILDEAEVSSDRNAMDAQKKSDLLLPPSLDTVGWKFNREEANER